MGQEIKYPQIFCYYLAIHRYKRNGGVSPDFPTLNVPLAK
jgi:hypothetical protein